MNDSYYGVDWFHLTPRKLSFADSPILQFCYGFRNVRF